MVRKESIQGYELHKGLVSYCSVSVDLLFSVPKLACSPRDGLDPPTDHICYSPVEYDCPVCTVLFKAWRGWSAKFTVFWLCGSALAGTIGQPRIRFDASLMG